MRTSAARPVEEEGYYDQCCMSGVLVRGGGLWRVERFRMQAPRARPAVPSAVDRRPGDRRRRRSSACRTRQGRQPTIVESPRLGGPLSACAARSQHSPIRTSPLHQIAARVLNDRQFALRRPVSVLVAIASQLHPTATRTFGTPCRPIAGATCDAACLARSSSYRRREDRTRFRRSQFPTRPANEKILRGRR